MQTDNFLVERVILSEAKYRAIRRANVDQMISISSLWYRMERILSPAIVSSLFVVYFTLLHPFYADASQRLTFRHYLPLEWFPSDEFHISPKTNKTCFQFPIFPPLSSCIIFTGARRRKKNYSVQCEIFDFRKIRCKNVSCYKRIALAKYRLIKL